MLPITSQPYTVPASSRDRAARMLARGVRPLVLNAIVLGTAFLMIVGGALAAQDVVIGWVEARTGSGPYLAIVLSSLTFVVPWLLAYFAWRPIWFAIARRRAAARMSATGALTATVDGNGIRIDEADLASSWLSWTAVTRLLVVDDTLVVARGTSGLVVSLDAIGGRPALSVLAAQLDPAALAASDPSIRDAVV